MHSAHEVLGRLQFALDECPVDNHLGGDIREFASLPGFVLLSHGFEDALHSVDSDRDAIDQRERLRMFREHRSKHA